MQSTGQTSIQASHPVQLSARTTASSLGSFLRALPAPFAMRSSPLGMPSDTRIYLYHTQAPAGRSALHRPEPITAEPADDEDHGDGAQRERRDAEQRRGEAGLALGGLAD